MPGTTERAARRGDRLASLAAFVWPFLFLFPYVLPVGGRFLLVGNDFEMLYYSYKAYLLDGLSHGVMPWWSPSEGGGFPFYSNPFSQAFYPLNIVLAAVYRVLGGWQYLDYQRYAVLGLGLFSLGLFRWLRSLGFERRTALSAAMVVAVSFKLTELLRFPNAIHSAAWYPWVLLGIGRVVESRTPRARILNGLLLAGTLVCLMTGGYPYYIVYAPFLFGPYVLIRLVPRWSRALTGAAPAHVPAALATLVSAAMLALAVVTPYLVKVGALMQQTTDRAGRSFDYSTEHVFSLTDTIGSWIFPPAAQIEGWYYFGIINALLIVVYVCQRRQPLAMVLLAWMAVITYVTYGRSSYLFTAMWHYLPLVASLRVWSRMNIILLPLIAWLLAAAYVHFESLLSPRAGEHADRRGALIILAASYAGVLALQLYANRYWIDYYWTYYYTGGTVQNGVLTALGIYLRRIGLFRITAAAAGAALAALWFVVPARRNLQVRLLALVALAMVAVAIVGRAVGGEALLAMAGLSSPVTREQLVGVAQVSFMAFAVLAFVVLAWLLVAARRFPGERRLRAAALPVVVMIAAADLWAVGPWAWAMAVWPAEVRSQVAVAAQNTNSFHVPRVEKQGLLLSGPFTVGTMENWYFERYNALLTMGNREPEALKQLLGVADGRKLYFSATIDHASIASFLRAAVWDEAIDVERYTGDELVVRIETRSDGYLSFIDNWDPDWRASVDAAPVPIELLFGTFKSVRVTAGQHIVRFQYRPYAAFGF